MARKSEKQRLQEGSHKSVIKNEPKPNKGISRMPRGLGTDATRLWSKLVPQLEKLGLATAIDEVALQSMCQWYQVYCDAAKTLSTIEDMSSIEGTRALNNCSKAFDNFRRLAQQFGLSPQARTGISIELSNDDSGDKFF